VTVKPGGSQNLERLWLNIQGGINPQVFPGICVLRSGHSIDILAPGVSKLSVVQRVCAEADAAITEVLCIGDQGCWPGNDHELLGVQHSLSVNATSSAPERCWNLAPIGVRESQATLGYLKMLSVTSRGIRFALPKLEKSK